jgi:ATP-dependent helicase/nuclease subunit A
MNPDTSGAERDPQRVAADPRLSAFVTANAGSGKTKTLIDRTARLLLEGVKPGAILCVTYTKAAAAEMQTRLYERLGGWSVMSSDDLRRRLAELQGRSPTDFDETDLSTARALFAQALETPGGLKIQTIHAFCEKLLRRFPLEAGVSPSFKVMDDADQAAVSKAARDAVAHAALAGSGAVAEAYARLSIALDFQSFETLLRDFEARRGGLNAYFDACRGLEGVKADVWRACGFDAAIEPDDLAAAYAAKLDRRLWREAAGVLAAGGVSDSKCAALLKAAADDPQAPFALALAAFFTAGGEGTPATWVAKTSGLKTREDLRMALLTVQDELGRERERLRAAVVAKDTVDVLVLAAAYIEAYRLEKAFAGALDFADLIDKTKDLLVERADAAWVLFKLDGGIDHVLVDEAQDTAPEQWRILRALTGEFFAGAGADRKERVASLPRSLFVVGDDKQSIYSFQGARPEKLAEETDAFLAAIAAVGARGERVMLAKSFRSAPPVLDFVDATFDDPDLLAGVQPASANPMVHLAHREGHAGCVDFWPLEREVKGDDREAWDAPLDVESEASANRRLAARIAAEIKALVERGDQVFANGWRAADYGDVLILVRRRGALFEDILRALKHARVPVAGADRLPLSQHIAFDDLLALSRFALFPEDELTLAALLKSPFCGLDDESLYALAHGRGKTNLWRRLQERAGERRDWSGALALLDWARTCRTATPFDFFARALERADDEGRSARARFLERLGAEAEDALAEFLSQTLAAEQRGARDLEAHAAAFARLDITVKREMDSARGEVRVMTTHGAKGLEAPIVFLPEMTFAGSGRGSPLMETDEGGFLWCASQKTDCEASAAARARRKARDEAEALRLFYVALTRARDRLVLCGRIAADAKEANVAGWYRAASAGFVHDRIAPHTRTAASGDFVFRRFGDDPLTTTPALPLRGGGDHPLPAWAEAPPAPETAPLRYAAPSALIDVDRGAAASPLAAVAGLGRYRRGDLIHRLLQVLPDLPVAQRRAAADRLLAAERDLTAEQRQEMAAAAFAVLQDPQFAEVFGPGSRPEVSIAGRAAALPEGLAISGRLDRLTVLPDRVLAIDFKTNRPAPARIEDADRAYRLQMAVYAAVLGELYPGRRIEAALVWTDGPKLMAVPEKVMAEALAELALAH